MYARKFTLRHTFEVSELIGSDGPAETHFGVPWFIAVGIKEDEDKGEDLGEPLIISLNCEKDADEKNPWSISFSATFRIENGNEKDKIEDSIEDCFNDNYLIEFEKECDWDTLMEKFVEDEKLTVEVDVVITEMKGFAPKRTINFDAAEEHMTDVVLAVGDRKFHVSKVILAQFADFFKPLFFSGYKESKQKEIKLEGVDPDTFQMLLEVIYGDLTCIQESTVEDLLVLARQYQVKVVTQRCVDFLKKKKVDLFDEEVIDLDLDMKFRLASTLNLLDLQDHLLEGIKSKEDSDKLLTRRAEEMSDSFIVKLIRKVYK